MQSVPEMSTPVPLLGTVTRRRKAQEMKNSLDAAMQGIEGLINSDGSGKQNLPE
jgi:hypothetical protein